MNMLRQTFREKKYLCPCRCSSFCCGEGQGLAQDLPITRRLPWPELVSEICRKFESQLDFDSRLRLYLAVHSKQISSLHLFFCSVMSDGPGNWAWIPSSLTKVCDSPFLTTLSLALPPSSWVQIHMSPDSVIVPWVQDHPLSFLYPVAWWRGSIQQVFLDYLHSTIFAQFCNFFFF